MIIADFPALFAEFSGKPFSLLWRVTRHGFLAADFRDCCDGNAPTLALIQDNGGNIFGASRWWTGSRFLCLEMEG
jgi:hypothetical protein